MALISNQSFRFWKLLGIALGVISAAGCMTSKRAEELDGKISQLRVDMGYEMAKVREAAMGSVRSSTEDVSRKTQGTKNEMEELRRQLALTQGALDELETKFSRYSSAIKNNSPSADDAAIRFSEIEYVLEKLERRMERFQLREENAGVPGKLPAKYDTAEKLEKALSQAFTQKDYKKVQTISSQVLSAHPSVALSELALRFRGEARFAAQDHAGSALDFSEFVDRFPRSSKYPRALLLAGDSYVYLRKFRVAKSFYTECSRVASEKEECKVSKERLAKLPAE